MYVEIMRDYRNEVEQYCIENGLSIDKVFSAPCAHNNERALLHHAPPPQKLIGWWEDIPSPTTLEIYLQKDGSLRFEQTELTRKYLGCETPVGVVAMA